MKEAVLDPLEKSGMVRLEHVRPSGKSMRPREGIIQKIDGQEIIFKRSFSPGRYDGLNLVIRKGDYGLTEIREGEWYVKHSYFSSERLLIGEYFNINTPVELYPYGARYVDLEVDVIRRAGEKAFEIDREKLGILTQRGCIGPELEARALHAANRILRSLNRDDATK
jgi:probable ribonuclease FAU-1